MGDYIGQILPAALATWFGLTKWLASRLHQQNEARMQAIETKQVDHEKGLANIRERNVSNIQRVEDRIQRVEDKLDAQYRVIDAKIDSVLRHLMDRDHNQRKGD